MTISIALNTGSCICSTIRIRSAVPEVGGSGCAPGALYAAHDVRARVHARMLGRIVLHRVHVMLRGAFEFIKRGAQYRVVVLCPLLVYAIVVDDTVAAEDAVVAVACQIVFRALTALNLDVRHWESWLGAGRREGFM